MKCNAAKRQPTCLATVLNGSTSHIRLAQDSELLGPFDNRKYRAHVRVVDFWPHKLKDFSVGRRQTEYDMLDDHSGGESTDNETDMKMYKDGKGFGGRKIWIWRFALFVEEVGRGANDNKERMWLIVDNQSAQMLLGMDAVE